MTSLPTPVSPVIRTGSLLAAIASAYLKIARSFSLREVNVELERLLTVFNNRIQKKYGLSRRQKFESFEQKKLKPLPEKAYESGHWKKVKTERVWVNGHWKKTPRGWIWLEGYWK